MFVGGAILSGLIDDGGAASARPTDDLDVIVDVSSGVAYDALGSRLRYLGFQPDTSEDARSTASPSTTSASAIQHDGGRPVVIQA